MDLILKDIFYNDINFTKVNFTGNVQKTTHLY